MWVQPRPAVHGWVPEAEESWGKANIPLVFEHFNKGTLPKWMCVELGLPKEWATPQEAAK